LNKWCSDRFSAYVYLEKTRSAAHRGQCGHIPTVATSPSFPFGSFPTLANECAVAGRVDIRPYKKKDQDKKPKPVKQAEQSCGHAAVVVFRAQLKRLWGATLKEARRKRNGHYDKEVSGYTYRQNMAIENLARAGDFVDVFIQRLRQLP
jgi:hypothetical protein